MTVEDLTVPLSQIYGPSAIYAHKIERLGEENEVKRAKCLYIVSSTHVNRPYDLPALDGFEPGTNGKPVGVLNITSGHAKDHFKQTPVFPGHKGIRAAVAYVDMLVYSSTPYDLHPNQVHLASLESVNFVNFVLPGSQLKISDVQNNFALATRTIEIKRGEEVVTEINGLKVGFYPGDKPLRAALLEDQLIESMVQSAAATALDLNKRLNGIPMFQSIGRTRFFAQALEGSKVEMVATTFTDKRGFKGNVYAFIDGVKIAESLDMKAMIVPKRVAERMLGIKLTG